MSVHLPCQGPVTLSVGQTPGNLPLLEGRHQTHLQMNSVKPAQRMSSPLTVRCPAVCVLRGHYSIFGFSWCECQRLIVSHFMAYWAELSHENSPSMNCTCLWDANRAPSHLKSSRKKSSSSVHSGLWGWGYMNAASLGQRQCKLPTEGAGQQEGYREVKLGWT